MKAFEELRFLVRALQEELSAFRRRALQAEGRVRELEESKAGPPVLMADAALTTQLTQLESQNAELQRRLDAATERTTQMVSRMRFLRQQQEGTK